MKVAVILSGCGVYDGSEIHEAVLSLLSLEKNQIEYICTSPDISQHHVINHINGEEMKESRNVLVESSRISRGEITKLDDLNKNEIDGIVIPGGFGSAKNLSKWAFEGSNGEMLKEIKKLILHCIENQKPIVALCISPVLLSKSFEGLDYNPKLTIGTTKEDSPYDIKEIQTAMQSLGSNLKNNNLEEICIDEDLKIISAPCYMMDAKIEQIYNNINLAIIQLKSMLNKK